MILGQDDDLFDQLDDLTGESAEFVAPVIEWWGVAPQLALLVGALLVILVPVLSPQRVPGWVSTALALVTEAAAFAFAVVLWVDVRDEGPRSIIADALQVDGFTAFVIGLVALSSMASTLSLDAYLRRERLAGPELHALLLTAGIGAIVMAQASDLIVLFLGLETLSLALYVMAALHLRRSTSQEAAVKYFVLGAFSSAFLLYGIALVYGATGSTNLVRIAEFLASTIPSEEGFLLVGMALLLVGIAFKIAAVPFHMWTPDVYQGSPTPVSGFMASVGKVGAFAAFVRIFVLTLQPYVSDWAPLVWALAALSLVVGSILAVAQTDVKRMLAYSSIAHAGYMLVALETGSAVGVRATLFYLFAYSFIVVGSFTAVAAVSGEGDANTTLSDMSGLAKRRPELAAAMALFLFAQAGVPFTSGFVAKFVAIQVATGDEEWLLASIAMLSAVIAAFFYLRVIMTMFVGDADEDAPPVTMPMTGWVTIGACVLVTLFFGLFPQYLLTYAEEATAVLVSGIPGL